MITFVTFVTFHAEDEPVPPDASVLYEAEWNEEATREQHEDALRTFAAATSTEVLVQVTAALLFERNDPSTGYVTVRSLRPCWNCGGSGVRCCEFGADRVVPS